MKFFKQWKTICFRSVKYFMMLRICVSIYLICLGLTLEEIRFYEFTKDTCHFIYGEPLDHCEEISDMQCVKSCMKHENCSSLLYEKATRQCFLNAKIPENESQYPADCGVQYAELGIRYLYCDGGWQYLNDKCYLYVDELLTWQGCDEYCIGINSSLAKLYDIGTHAVLFNVTESGRLTATNTNSHWYWRSWISVNDLFEENVYTDRDGVPINPELLPILVNLGENYDCGVVAPLVVRLKDCNLLRSCLCEKNPNIFTRRAKKLK